MKKNLLYTIAAFTIGTCAFIMGIMLSQKAAVNAQKGTETALNAEMIQIYNIKSEQDYNTLCNALEARNGKIVIEISCGMVTSENGDGLDICGYYRAYDPNRFSNGDMVQSIFIYSPGNNYIDDVVCRIDTLIE